MLSVQYFHSAEFFAMAAILHGVNVTATCLWVIRSFSVVRGITVYRPLAVLNVLSMSSFQYTIS